MRRNRILDALVDRLEDRLIDAPSGLHEVGEPADPEALRAANLPDEVVPLWERWDGIELGNGEARILPLADHATATERAAAAGLLRAGDRVIGEQGPTLLVLPTDPWAEGGEVVAVEDDGQRAPLASSLLKLALGLVGEMSLLYDEEGEYHDELFSSNGALRAKAERKLLRRRLDFDEDAPLPRFRLAQLLRRAGEARGAQQELDKVLVCAPEFMWAHFELGRAWLDLDRRADATKSFAAAVERADDDGLRAYFLAWQVVASGDAGLAARVLALDPAFANTQEAAVREAIANEDPRGRELLALGLAVMPTHLGLLASKAAVEALPIGEDTGPDEFDEPDEVDREIAKERAEEETLPLGNERPPPRPRRR